MEDQSKERNGKPGKVLKLLLKILVMAACLWYVSTKIDFTKAGATLRQADWFFVFLALIAFVVSKIFSAIRLNIYFANINIHLSQWVNLKLYWLGMLYNLFLPGSISGDAYKVIRLSRIYSVPYKKTSAAVLLDRFSGLLGLALLLAVYACLVIRESKYILLIIAAAIAGSVGFYLLLRYWQKDFLRSFWITLFWGVAVQAMQVISAYLIMEALGISTDHSSYILLFLLSSVVAVLPLTIGGLGAREVVFVEGSAYLGLTQENAVIISLLFYLITLFTSAWGAFFIFKEPLEMKKDPK